MLFFHPYQAVKSLAYNWNTCIDYNIISNYLFSEIKGRLVGTLIYHLCAFHPVCIFLTKKEYSSGIRKRTFFCSHPKVILLLIWIWVNHQCSSILGRRLFYPHDYFMGGVRLSLSSFAYSKKMEKANIHEWVRWFGHMFDVIYNTDIYFFPFSGKAWHMASSQTSLVRCHPEQWGYIMHNS